MQGELFMDYFIKTIYAILTTCGIYAVLIIFTMSLHYQWISTFIEFEIGKLKLIKRNHR